MKLTLLYSSTAAETDPKNCQQVLIGLQPLRYTFASTNEEKIATYREDQPGTQTIAYLALNTTESAKIVTNRDEVKTSALHPQAVAVMV